MSDDTFIREVNEQMRRERMETVWKRFGKYIVAFIVLIVVGTIAYVVWERQQATRAAADGDRYFAAVDLATGGDTPGAVSAFEALAADGVGAYPHLARLRIAATLAESGDRAGAVARLDEVASSSAPQSLRDIAAVRAAYLLVDEGAPADVRERVERLTGEAAPLRHPAREALGLSLWRAGDGEAARGFFQQITEDLSAPSGIAERARLMLAVIDSGAAVPEPGTLPAPAASTADTPAPAALDPLQAVEPQAGPVDEAPAPATVDPALTTPLADQLDLPAEEAELPAAPPAAEAPAAAESPAETADEPAAPLP